MLHIIFCVVFAGIRGEIQTSIALKLPLSSEQGYVRILSGSTYMECIIFRFSLKKRKFYETHFMDYSSLCLIPLIAVSNSSELGLEDRFICLLCDFVSLLNGSTAITF